VEISYFYYLFGRRWPMLLLVLAGILVALVRWKRHPKVSLLTVSGLGLFILQSLTFGSVFYLLPRLHDRGFSYGNINNLYLIIEVCRDIFYSAVIVLLVSAVLTQRSQTKDQTNVITST
jgi:hypothetical protein